MDSIEWKPVGTNIQVQPVSKNKIVGNTAKYHLYGEVVAIGDKVSRVAPGDFISWTLWGIKDSEMADGTKRWFVRDDDDFIVEIGRKNG